MGHYRKKPVVIQAVQWTGENLDEICAMAADQVIETSDGVGGSRKQLNIRTLEGLMRASEGDYIIKGVKGEIYPCKPDIFKETYEAV